MAKPRIREYLFDNRCPKCNSKQLGFDSIEPVDELMKQGVHCNECHFDFEIFATCQWTYTEVEA